ncbi:hypothetical protein TNCV_3624091 [Trichonephila clavipes]|nr:hypothetical protein TNCV_3624091 [Trichonephila clavipes]
MTAICGLTTGGGQLLNSQISSALLVLQFRGIQLIEGLTGYRALCQEINGLHPIRSRSQENPFDRADNNIFGHRSSGAVLSSLMNRDLVLKMTLDVFTNEKNQIFGTIPTTSWR